MSTNSIVQAALRKAMVGPTGCAEPATALDRLSLPKPKFADRASIGEP
jgi:hypothetical protein